jgi:hypothetical protein
MAVGSTNSLEHVCSHRGCDVIVDDSYYCRRHEQVREAARTAQADRNRRRLRDRAAQATATAGQLRIGDV